MKIGHPKRKQAKMLVSGGTISRIPSISNHPFPTIHFQPFIDSTNQPSISRIPSISNHHWFSIVISCVSWTVFLLVQDAALWQENVLGGLWTYCGSMAKQKKGQNTRLWVKWSGWGLLKFQLRPLKTNERPLKINGFEDGFPIEI